MVAITNYFSHTDIEELPFGDNTVINFDLFANFCPNLRKLPNNLMVNGSLNLIGCKSLGNLPSGLVVRSLALSESQITNLPSDIFIQNKLQINNCHYIEYLPENLYVPEIDVSDCKFLKTLPTSLKCSYLKINRCKSILSEIINSVYTDVSYDHDRKIIISYLSDERSDWLHENNIKVSIRYFPMRPFPAHCHVIDDPADLMLYRLRWN